MGNMCNCFKNTSNKESIMYVSDSDEENKNQGAFNELGACSQFVSTHFDNKKTPRGVNNPSQTDKKRSKNNTTNLSGSQEYFLL
jgi:hypothetical protein